MEVLGVDVRREGVSVAVEGAAPSEGELVGLVEEVMLVRLDFRGEALRAWRSEEPFTESKLPCDMSCRQDLIRSSGGWVDVLSLLARPVPLERILLGRPILVPVRFERTEPLSQLSAARCRFK